MWPELVERHKLRGCVVLSVKFQPFALGADPLGNVVYIRHHYAFLFAHEHNRTVHRGYTMRVLLVNRGECELHGQMNLHAVSGLPRAVNHSPCSRATFNVLLVAVDADPSSLSPP